MLLYTRRAPPKEAKRRSRAGCTNCKDKKKKCSEERPSCLRCTERGLECQYEAVQPRKRRRTGSPADSSLKPTSTNTSPRSRSTSCVRSLYNTPIPPLSLSQSSPSLSVVSGSWDMQSSYDDSASAYASDFHSDSSASPQLMNFDFMDPMPPPPVDTMRHSSVPVEAMNMYLPSTPEPDFDIQRAQDHLSVHDFSSPQYRRTSQSGTSIPEMMTVPYRRPSDQGVAEIMGTIPIHARHRVDSPDMVTSNPTSIPGSGPFQSNLNIFPQAGPSVPVAVAMPGIQPHLQPHLHAEYSEDFFKAEHPYSQSVPVSMPMSMPIVSQEYCEPTGAFAPQGDTQDMRSEYWGDMGTNMARLQGR